MTAKSNPALPNQCGLDVLLLLDRSGSIEDDAATYEDAAQEFVSTLAGTPTRLKIFSFGPTASADQNTFLNLQTPADVTAANNVIEDVYDNTSGGTNWDEGLELASGAGVDVVLFITDGNPTVRANSSGSNNTVDLLDLTMGMASANRIKTQGKSAGVGATVLAIGVGDTVTPANLSAVSGPTLGDDYFTSGVDQLAAELQASPTRCAARGSTCAS